MLTAQCIAENSGKTVFQKFHIYDTFIYLFSNELHCHVKDSFQIILDYS